MTTNFWYGDPHPEPGEAAYARSGLPHPERFATGHLTIDNKGPEIIRTNFFETGAANAGMLFLSFNDRTARLLVPAPLSDMVEKEIRSAHRVQVDMGPCPPRAPLFPPHAYRLIFDDRSDSPFYLLVGSGQYDRVVPGREHDTELPAIVYGPGLRVLKRCPGRFRRVAYLPEVDDAIRDIRGAR